MASNKKKRKLKNTNFCKTTLKIKNVKLKHYLFHTSAQRQNDKIEARKEIEQEKSLAD